MAAPTETHGDLRQEHLERGKIAIVGSGLIGRGWSMLFAAVGHPVCVYDVEPKQVLAALEFIEAELKRHEKEGTLRGTLNAAQQRALISSSSDLKSCVSGAIHVQECVPEDLELKKRLFEQLDAVAPPGCVLASSTSCLLPSTFSEKLKNRSHVIVAHPVNPPYYVPLVEIVPAPWTDAAVATRTRALMESIGQAPVSLSREIPGFCLNRIQYAIINECWRMAEDGVLSVADIDKVMWAGLGPRYAFLGPLETAHLNADGMVDYMRRHGAGLERVSATMGPTPAYTEPPPSLEQINKQLQEMTPLGEMGARRAWRDKMLSALARLKRDMETE